MFKKQIVPFETMITKDSLGDRMKGYENETRSLLRRKGFYIIRVDGKAFHTYTRNLAKPFDDGLKDSFSYAMKVLFDEVQGAVLAYHQSDEISIFFSDTQTEKTDLWFGGNIQKIASVSASIVTCAFNRDRIYGPRAYFDARVFQLPSLDEVNNYFRWRNLDALRNGISGIAQSLYSCKELEGKSTKERSAMISEMGFYWTDRDVMHTHGTIIFSDGERTAWKFCGDNGKLMNILQKGIDKGNIDGNVQP